MLPRVALVASFQAMEARQVAEAALDHPAMPAEAAPLYAFASDPVLGSDLVQGGAVAGLVVAFVGVPLAAEQASDPAGEALHQRA